MGQQASYLDKHRTAAGTCDRIENAGIPYRPETNRRTGRLAESPPPSLPDDHVGSSASKLSILGDNDRRPATSAIVYILQSRELHDAPGICAFGTHPVMRLGQLLFDPQTLFLFPSTTNLEIHATHRQRENNLNSELLGYYG
ncbi:hypothetical protein CIHG_05612 [Coccidioides immitis H538.4]|uniref:Uncharacterized protein n=1 Tax=Coccidioides immitis H538.4 TaxID=396776 RepID=A0A0J8RRI5_COCIT|nr:hypothetical protein CIHG_05612 [Coccidioides immitis H538.4]